MGCAGRAPCPGHMVQAVPGGPDRRGLLQAACAKSGERELEPRRRDKAPMRE